MSMSNVSSRLRKLVIAARKAPTLRRPSISINSIRIRCGSSRVRSSASRWPRNVRMKISLSKMSPNSPRTKRDSGKRAKSFGDWSFKFEGLGSGGFDGKVIAIKGYVFAVKAAVILITMSGRLPRRSSPQDLDTALAVSALGQIDP